MPLPRWSLPLALVLLLLPAGTLAGPTLGGAVHGAGTASVVHVARHAGTGAGGGLHAVNHACLDCFVNLTVVSGEVVVVQDGRALTLAPGTWQFREFQGYFGYSYRAPWTHDFRIEGTGRVARA